MACPIGVSISDGGDAVSFIAEAAPSAIVPGFSLRAAALPAGFPELSLLVSEVVMVVSEGMTLVATAEGEAMLSAGQGNLIVANKNASGGLVGEQQQNE